MSKYLYFSLVSSSAVVLSVISNGISIDLLINSKELVSTSISPVGILSFLLSLSTIFPVTLITDSFFRDDAVS